ncbi:MAG: hypothetical protein ACREMB_16255 [Candidatus Rokuibacteriota bacterium]
MAGRRRRNPPLEEMLGHLARRTNDLFLALAQLDARVNRLEETLDAVREECAKLIRNTVKAAVRTNRPARAPRRARLRLLASVGVNGHTTRPPRPLRLIA